MEEHRRTSSLMCLSIAVGILLGCDGNPVTTRPVTHSEPQPVTLPSPSLSTVSPSSAMALRTGAGSETRAARRDDDNQLQTRTLRFSANRLTG
jgi:hypothetical protein